MTDPSAASTTTRPTRVLIADDQADVLEALRLLLKGAGYKCEQARSPAAVLTATEAQDFDVVLMDLNYARDTTSGQEGLDLLARLQAADATLPIVVMTAWGSVELAVEAMRRGARDFIQKPWENARLLAIVGTQAELGQALRRGQRLEAENWLLRGDGPALIAESPAMQPVLQLIARMGPADANVLITGDNGTGKGVVAGALHGVSTRSSKPLMTINAGGVSEGVFESELFGHVKGAFTDAKVDRVGRFDLADGGTLFLDEIANVPLSQQAKLLRVLETGEFERLGSSRTRRVNVRVISATNADLGEAVVAGAFRQDLLFRLNTIEIRMPPLRERREDISLLAAHFLRQHARHYRKTLTGFDASAMQALLSHTWPGNVRELDHVVERAVLMATNSTITHGDLLLHSNRDAPAALEEMSLEEVEAFLIKKTMARYDGPEAAGLSDDLDAGARTDACGAGTGHRLERFEVSDAPGRLDANLRAHDRPHERHVRHRGAAGAEPGRGLHEIGSGHLGQCARDPLLVIGQRRGLDDDLAERLLVPARHGDGLDVALDQGAVATLQRADVDHHVDLGGSVRECAARLVLFDVWRGRPERKPHDRADPDGATGQALAGASHPGGVQADRGEPMLHRLVAQHVDLSLGGIRAKQGVVDRLRHVACGPATGVQPQPRGPGVQDSPQPIGAALRQHTVARTATAPLRTPVDLLHDRIRDGLDQPVHVAALHRPDRPEPAAPGCSNRWIFATRLR